MRIRRTRFEPRLAPTLTALVLATGCAVEDRSKQKYEFVIRVHGDPGRPLAGVPLSYAGEKVAVSNGQGKIVLSAQGTEGETVAFEVTCPEGHRAPAKPLSIVLRRLSERDKRPEYTVSCAPLTRTLVVAVRADNGANLPVRHLGREVARTDAAGAAHVVLEAQPDDSLELTLDTSEQPGLRPTNPSTRFAVSARDEVVAFNQRFEPPKLKKAVVQRPVPRGPRRID